MRCKTCHYSLAGLTEHRCPECGHEFNPNDPTTFSREAPIVSPPEMHWLVPALRRALLWLLGVYLAIFLSLNCLLTSFFHEDKGLLDDLDQVALVAIWVTCPFIPLILLQFILNMRKASR